MRVSVASAKQAPKEPGRPGAVVLLLLGLMLVPACCTGGPKSLSIWTTPPTQSCDWQAIKWGGITEVVQGDSVIAVYASGETIGTAAELYKGDQQIPLEQRTEQKARCPHGCPSPRTWYLLNVPAGEYTLVHRESSGTGNPVHTPESVEPDPWTSFENERALVTTLIVKAPPKAGPSVVACRAQ